MYWRWCTWVSSLAHLGTAACAQLMVMSLAGALYSQLALALLATRCIWFPPVGDGAWAWTQDYAPMPYGAGLHGLIVHIVLGDVGLTGIDVDFHLLSCGR